MAVRRFMVLRFLVDASRLPQDASGELVDEGGPLNVLEANVWAATHAVALEAAKADLDDQVEERGLGRFVWTDMSFDLAALGRRSGE